MSDMTSNDVAAPQSGRRTALSDGAVAKPAGNFMGPPDWVIQVTLAEPIVLRAKESDAIIEQIDGLRFRRPTALDLIEVGGPPCTMDIYHDNPPSTTTFDGKKMSAMMSRLSTMTTAHASRMSTGDWMYCAYQLSPFFYPVTAKAS